ncbi:O-antigen ligase family protein [Hahella ganghwensis]|uniref:O-antigen ligase family protein n=1 Tax=Hahella ganghwensis TaxID=286420 RepID=UPI001FE1184D|nr:O-antigen ligase family protein [Hahella ganghwensis]
MLWDRFDIIFLLFICAMLLTQLSVYFLDGISTKVSHVLRYLVLGWMIRYSRFLPWQYWIILGVGVFSTLLGIAWSWPQYLSSHQFIDLDLPNIQHVNHASLYVLIVLQIMLSSVVYLILRSRYLASVLMLIVAILPLIWLMAASSRAAVGVALLSIGLCVLVLSLKNRLQAIIFVIGMISLGSVVLINYSGAISKQAAWSSAFEGKMSPRERIWNTAFESYSYAPYLGRGYDQYKQLTKEHVKKLVEGKGEKFEVHQFYFTGHAHNVYITWLIEHGAVGLIILVSFFAVWLSCLWKDFHRLKQDYFLAWWWTCAANVLLTLSVAGLVTTTMRRDTAFIALVVFGLYAGYSRLGSQAERNDSKALFNEG